MAPLDDTTPETRFDSFHIHRIPYKKVEDHEIEVGILVPKDLKSGKHPLIVNFHGGSLIYGDCLYPDWMPAFLIPFFHRTNAIVVLPNYRLIPESTGADILSDLNDFWTWFHAGNVTKYLTSQYSSPIDLDYSRILVSGGSAGGYMALMTGLTQPQGTIKAILAQYPMSGHLNIEPSETFFGFPSPGPEVIDQHIASIRPGTIVSSATPPARLNLSYPMGAYNRYLEFFGYDKKLWPIHLIESKDWMPPTWIFHGDADSAVNIKDSLLFAEKWKKYIKGNECRLEVREGMEHGFDTSIKEDEEAWLREGLAWVEEQWLK